MDLVPLPVAIPLLVAAALTAGGHFLSRPVDDVIGIAAAAATTTISTILVVRSLDHDLVYWFGAWRPRRGIAVGIAFDVDPLGAVLAALAGALMTASFVFAWRYFDEVGTLFHVLMLAFLGAMTGFALSGDLFNMFVFFELMSVCAFALAGYAAEQPATLQGAINFAVTNTVGAVLLLTGIGLLYGRTGALNLSQIGQSLAGGGAPGLVLVAFALLLGGFLVKAGAVPFHFWLSDAYAVAPIPVCVLLSGVMSDLGLHGVARVYWPVFSGVLAANVGSVRAILVGAGVLTALVGAAMAFFQRDLKRLLAFVTISHVGVFLVGLGLLTARGLAGTTLYVVADGFVKGGLFLAVGILIRRARSGDELTLRGRGGVAPTAGIAFLLGGLGLAGLPPFGMFLGFALITRSAIGIGYGWLPPLLTAATIVTGGTVLRAGARIFLGWGDAEDPSLSHEPPAEEEEPQEPTGRLSPPLLFGPALALIAVGLGLAFTPGLADRATQWAQRFEARPAHAAEVLRGVEPTPVAAPSFQAGAAPFVYATVSTLGALGFAAFGLYRRRLPALLRRWPGRVTRAPATTLKALHSGVVGDYVAWLTFGVAALGGLLALLVR
jgi:multicomponent Na+:H+ antiporter subunit D